MYVFCLFSARCPASVASSRRPRASAAPASGSSQGLGPGWGCGAMARAMARIAAFAAALLALGAAGGAWVLPGRPGATARPRAALGRAGRPPRYAPSQRHAHTHTHTHTRKRTHTHTHTHTHKRTHARTHAHTIRAYPALLWIGTCMLSWSWKHQRPMEVGSPKVLIRLKVSLYYIILYYIILYYIIVYCILLYTPHSESIWARERYWGF